MDVSDKKISSIIAEIVDENDCGMNAFVHRKSLKLTFIPNEFNHYLDDFEDLFKDELDEINMNLNLYFKIEPPSSHESFNIMKSFAENLDQSNLKEQLFSALNKRKPFAHFKHIIDHSNIREKWFAFKKQESIQRVELEFKHEFQGPNKP